MEQIEVEDLPKFGWIHITWIGEENMYFTHNNKEYYCKVCSYFWTQDEQ